MATAISQLAAKGNGPVGYAYAKVMSTDVDTIVIGAGVVGLAIARALALKGAPDGREVLVVEQHDCVGSETSSRNSEAIHAGIYYPKGSRRALHCVQGKRMLYRFCAENGVAARQCGKLIVAVSEEQIARLAAIEATAAGNGAGDLVRLTPQEVRAIEPEVQCLGALLSPSTGIVDSHAFMLALQGEAEAHGAQIALRSQASRLKRLNAGGFAVELAGGGAVTCNRLVASAGLHASRLADTLAYPEKPGKPDKPGKYVPPRTYYAKGHYYALAGKSPFSRHIYPVPDGAWLGLHATVDIAARCKFGPDIAWVGSLDYGFEPDRLVKFLNSIRAYYPALDEASLHPDYTGIRPKLYKEGEQAADFAIHGPASHGHDGLVMLFGIESPGLTAAMSIAEEVALLLD